MNRLLAMPGEVLGVAAILAMLSFALAELYLLVFALPIYIGGAMTGLTG